MTKKLCVEGVASDRTEKTDDALLFAHGSFCNILSNTEGIF